MAIGQLKGTMMETTPSGWYDTVVCTGMAPGTGGSTFAVSTSSAWLSASFQRISSTSESTQASKRILPFSCDRIAASASRFAPSMPFESGQHLLGALLRREGGPGRIRGLGGGNGIADILRRGRRGMTDHDARLGRIGNRHLVRGLSLLAPDEQRGGDRTGR